ncbi:hypothetical protein GN956_G12936 [Arapaima gigas]
MEGKKTKTEHLCAILIPPRATSLLNTLTLAFLEIFNFTLQTPANHLGGACGCKQQAARAAVYCGVGDVLGVGVDARGAWLRTDRLPSLLLPDPGSFLRLRLFRSVFLRHSVGVGAERHRVSLRSVEL